MPGRSQRSRDIVVIGASAGGIRALRTVLCDIPAALPATIAIVQHRSPFHRDSLARVIADGSPHEVREPADAEAIRRGNVYLAPPDRHLRMEPHGFRLERGPKEHFTRPAIDVLFRTAAETYGERVIGVILTGGGRDGNGGLAAIKQAGGFALVQDPRDAEAPMMPTTAIQRSDPDLVVSLSDMAEAITALVTGRPLPFDRRTAVAER